MNKNTFEMEAKRSSKDRISALPSVLIENILCRVSLRDAVRTSILSKNWRYNWATIPKLVFKEDNMFDKLFFQQTTKMIKAIHKVLLLHQGPILELTLPLCSDNRFTVDYDHILLHLSRKIYTLKKLALHFLDYSLCKVPSYVFSLHQLTELSLSRCDLDLNLAFGRLPSLTTLSLVRVSIYKETLPLHHLNPSLSGLPSLTSLSMRFVSICRETVEHLISTSPLLKWLQLKTLRDLEHESLILHVDIFKLFKFFPLIEHMSVSSKTLKDFKYSAQDVVSQELKTTLLYLKSLSMWDMQFDCKLRLDGLFHLIRSCPNLQKIKLKNEPEVKFWTHDTKIKSLGDHSYIWLEHLHEFEIKCFNNSKLELEFVKLILTKSPMLKKVMIRILKWVGNGEKLDVLRSLKCCHRASSVAEIKVSYYDLSFEYVACNRLHITLDYN